MVRNAKLTAPTVDTPKRVLGGSMIPNGYGPTTYSETYVWMSEELIALLRQRVAARYYDQPQVIDVIARAILHSRGVYPT